VSFLSGIAAIVHFDGSDVPQSEVERLTNVLKPFGPHRQRALVLGCAAFVFCLDTIVSEDVFERQPLLLAERFVLLFDGRIDNRPELGSALSISAEDLSVMPDSMIALQLFNRWGEAGFTRIDGVFAIIVVDLEERRIVCARDHLGLRVLHYYQAALRFAVATVPEALFALSWVPRRLNREKLADTLVWRGLNGETTNFREVFRVLPGHMITVLQSKFHKMQFWNPEAIADVNYKRDKDYVDAFKEHLSRAVKNGLRSSRTPCAAITGGLDSSTIAVVAADMLLAKGEKLNTFTSVPELGFTRQELRGRYFDETPYVKEIANFNKNILPHFVSQDSEPFLEKIAKVMRLSGLPGGTLNCLWAVDLFSAAQSAGYTVMLGGEMGNLTMSYQGFGLFAELAATGRWFRLLAEIASSGDRWRDRVRNRTIAPLIPMPIFKVLKRRRRGTNPPWHDYSLIRPEFADQAGVVERAARENSPFDHPGIRNSKLSRVADFGAYCESADWFAKVRANFRLDIRTPAFDRRLVEFCIGIPTEQYLHHGCDRWLIRRAMEGRLPNNVLRKKKWGAQAADWFTRMTRDRNRMTEEIRRLAQNTEVASIIDMERCLSILDNWPDKQPAEYTSEEKHLLALPDALGVAYFVETMSGRNGAVAMQK
jgi:asparagine synthase (glutamine-hydrolysing)